MNIDFPTLIPSGDDDVAPSALPERILLILAGLFLCINYVALALQRPDEWWSYGLVLLAWIVAAVGGHIILSRTLPTRDLLIFPLVMFMSGWGLVVIDRLAPRFADRQAIWLPLAILVMLAVAIYPNVLRWLRNYRYLWLLTGLALLLATIALGRNPTGDTSAPQLWLGIGNLNFQPAELLKVILVVFLASYLAEQYPALRAEGLAADGRSLPTSPRVFGPILLMWSLCIVVLIWQRDLGTAAIFFIVFSLLLYVASGYTFVLIGGAVLLVAAGVVAYSLFDVVSLRVDIWINPWPESDGRAFQIVQSLQAFAAGGVFGQGIGQGSPTFIPVVHSDFVFAAIAEEYGLLGVVVVLGSIGTLLLRGIRIATLNQNQAFQGMLAIGLSLLIGVQSLLIMGGVLRLVPLTGVTLPYFSYGGSSLLMSFVIAGLLLRLSAET